MTRKSREKLGRKLEERIDEILINLIRTAANLAIGRIELEGQEQEGEVDILGQVVMEEISRVRLHMKAAASKESSTQTKRRRKYFNHYWIA
jgi:hypothetical protein